MSSTVDHPAQNEKPVNRSRQGWQSASADFVNVASDFKSLVCQDVQVDKETVCCPAFLDALPLRLRRDTSPCHYAGADAGSVNPNTAATDIDADLHADAHTHARTRRTVR